MDGINFSSLPIDDSGIRSGDKDVKDSSVPHVGVVPGAGLPVLAEADFVFGLALLFNDFVCKLLIVIVLHWQGGQCARYPILKDLMVFHPPAGGRAARRG